MNAIECQASAGLLYAPVHHLPRPDQALLFRLDLGVFLAFAIAKGSYELQSTLLVPGAY